MSNVSYEANIWTMVRTADFPSRLFKFMKAEHAALMCQSNRVRYGTIYDFRKQENHAHGVLDKEEGLIHYTEHVTEATASQLGHRSKGSLVLTLNSRTAVFAISPAPNPINGCTACR
jgi:hypothetical protein